MMTAQPLDQWPKWRDQLVYYLRMAEIPGDRIGDILLEVESHIQETGETPDEAFGGPKEYASRRAITPDDSDEEDASIWMIVIASFTGSYLFSSGAIAIGKETDALFGMNAWIACVLGLLVLTATAVLMPIDIVRHPTTGKPLLGDPAIAKPVLLGAVIILGFSFYLVGRLLAG